MSGFFHALASEAFLQRALLGGVLASLGCGLVGTFVVVRRIGYLAGGIAHAVLGGMGIAYFLGRAPIWGAVIAALVAAMAIALVTRRSREREDVLIGAVWAVGMAVGILFISRTPGYNVDLMSYLFGSILMIGARDLWPMAVLDLVLVAMVVVFYKQLVATSFDEEFARLRGVHVEVFHALLLCMVALTVVLLVQVVGLVLVIALLTLPAAIAAQYRRSLVGIMVVATVLAALLTVGGLGISYGPDLPAGATIIVLAATAYLLSTGLVYAARRIRMHRAR